MKTIGKSSLRENGAVMRLATIVSALAVATGLVAAEKPQAPRTGPVPCSPALEQAAAALAENRFGESEAKFQTVAADPNTPAFARGLALLGLAESDRLKKDFASAVKILGRLADDGKFPLSQRETARRRIEEIERGQKGLPARDPAKYRVTLPVLGAHGATFHVAPGAAPAGDGSELKPFATLEQARDAIRALKRARGGQLPPGGVRVVVRGGEYRVTNSLRLTAEDSGTSNAPVVYQAKSGENPVFTGGLRVANWRPVADTKLREKLDPAVRDRVLEADLTSLGLKDWGDATELRQRPELFCDGAPQILARWPNQGFVMTGEALGQDKINAGTKEAGSKDGKFRYLEDRPARWVDEPDPRLYGYWYWDWYEEYQKVAAIDPAQRSITLSRPYSNYGYRQGQRYCAMNLLTEIDMPGEWYLDRRTGTIYWLPPEEFDSKRSQVTLSVFSQPFITMREVEHVILEGLTLQEGRHDAIHIANGAHCLIAGCTIRRCGGDAIVVEGGTNHGLFGTTVHTMGCGGMKVNGGSRTTLIAGGHFVENCTVNDISRLKRTYTPAVLLDGCGNRVAHNLFEHMPSSALRIEGNDQTIELNRIRQVVRESDDQGGLDIFGNPLYRGVVIRWNHWSDIGGGTHCGAAGVRLDDMISGVAIQGNVFERCGAAIFGGVQIHGGKENWVDGNLFLDCFAGVSFSRWGEKRWLEFIQKFMAQAGAPPYSERYPELAALKLGADINHISRNVFARCASVYLRDGGVELSALNRIMDTPIDPKALSDERAIQTDPQLRRLLFDPIPWPEIGPYEHPWRAAAIPAGR